MQRHAQQCHVKNNAHDINNRNRKSATNEEELSEQSSAALPKVWRTFYLAICRICSILSKI
jgi:hypothetical protein